MNALTPVDEAEPLVTSTFVVEGIHCAACIAKIERGLGALPGVIGVRVNFSTRRVRVDHAASTAEDAILREIGRIGFAAHPFAGEVRNHAGREGRALVLALAVAGFAAMNVMLLSVSVWSGADGATRGMFHWLSALIALPAIAYSGQPFFRSAWRALRQGRTNMDVPISIGVTLTAAMSLYETATGGAHAYFDGAIMLLFFLLAGRVLDNMMRARAEDGVAALLRRVPTDALVLGASGQAVRRAADEIAPGMRILVAAGERIAADGVIEEGETTIDRSLVTGESIPEDSGPDGRVLAGTINLAAPIRVRVTAAGTSTAIADIARLMENAGQSKSRYVRIADRASRLYAPAVHTLAALTLAGWLIAGADLHHAMLTAVAVLIITCPCALGLAVPIAQVVAAGALMRKGILIKDGSALERLAAADTMLLDKTGTITLGKVKVMGGRPEDPRERAALIALARASRHPLAQAIAADLDGIESAPLTELVEHPGLGIEARLDEQIARLGRPDWVAPEAPGRAGAATEVAFRIGTAPVRHIILSDTLRRDATAAITRLRAEGFKPEIVSGDSPAVVEALSDALGIAGNARMSPADKQTLVKALEAGGKNVVMVGDGLNDGPALKAASVAIAPATASDVGQLAADLVFFGDRLMPVPIAIAAARRTMQVVRQNFVVAIGYNLLAVPLAIAGLVTPLVAALAMSGSSLLVVANAMRLRSAAK